MPIVQQLSDGIKHWIEQRNEGWERQMQRAASGRRSCRGPPKVLWPIMMATSSPLLLPAASVLWDGWCLGGADASAATAVAPTAAATTAAVVSAAL